MRPVINIYRTFRSFRSRSSCNENIINNCITIAINSLRSTRSFNISRHEMPLKTAVLIGVVRILAHSEGRGMGVVDSLMKKKLKGEYQNRITYK